MDFLNWIKKEERIRFQTRERNELFYTKTNAKVSTQEKLLRGQPSTNKFQNLL